MKGGGDIAVKRGPGPHLLTHAQVMNCNHTVGRLSERDVERSDHPVWGWMSEGGNQNKNMASFMCANTHWRSALAQPTNAQNQ